MNNEQKPSRPARAKHSSKRSLITLVVVLVAAAGLYLYGPTVADAARAAQFKPSASIAAVTNRIDLTPRAEQIFYATGPKVVSKSQFNDDCQSIDRTAAILGCYTGDQIYLYNINDPELDGALEVTAAHELLHAAYARLNIFEKANVDKMINAEYVKLKHNPALTEVMQYYTKAEPGQETNELHSMIGTTIKDLPPALEQYYAQYFTNRAAIVAMNAKYTAVFDKLNQQATALQAKITSEAATVKVQMASYNSDLDQLNSDIQSFNQRASSGDFRSQYSFNVARGALVARVQQLTDRQTELNSQINTYNTDVADYNKLAVRSKQLNESINGVEAPDGV